MLQGKIYANRKYEIGEIDSRVYGSFLEHMGRVIYTGIYEPEHEKADEDGFRGDVLEQTRKMGVTAVRYPGGNYVSTYHWEDGVGPKNERPRRVELAWRSIETNEFGTNEFMRWAKKAGVEPILTINLGTRGVEDAVYYLEYCNFDGGTTYSDLRKSHGILEPYKVKTWCLGNEMDGKWQIGHKSAEEYGRLAAETGKAMKRLDPDIELILCGSSLSTMNTYPEWDQKVLEEAYDVVDYLALHQYYGGQEKGTAYFLAQTLDMENYIDTIAAVTKVVKQKKNSSKEMYLSMDEWGVWAVPSETVVKETQETPWEIAPSISEQIYTMEDALLFAGMQMVMLRHVDKIKIACQSLLTNISACIMTEKGGEMWLQTIYYPFYYFANYAKGTVLISKTESETYSCETYADVPYLDELVVWNHKKNEVCVFMINKNETEEMEVEITLEGVAFNGIREAVTLYSVDSKINNRKEHHAVEPQKLQNVKLCNETAKAVINPLSFSMVVFEV